MKFRIFKMVHPDDFEPIIVFSVRHTKPGLPSAVPDEVIAWCRDQFGEEERVRWEFGFDTVMFKQDLDATAFKLRWV